MCAAFYVTQIRQHVDAFRLQLNKYGAVWDDLASTDVETIAIGYLGCRIIQLPHLTDAKALQHLKDCFGLDTSAESGDEGPLAGALYFAADTGSSWIYVEQTDIPTRQRFTVAHELGHFVNEAQPAFRRLRTQATSTNQPLLRFSRCSTVALDSTGEPPSVPTSGLHTIKKHWTDDDLKEINANRFAAEVLMPYRGMRSIIAKRLGPNGVESQQEFDELLAEIAKIYNVSRACAERRLRKDLRISVNKPSARLELF